MNPYRPLPDSDEPTAFAGRREAFARLYQHLKDPTSTGAMIFTGWPMVGKTTFLRQFDSVFDDSMIGVYVSPLNIKNEDDLLRTLIASTVRVLAGRDFTLARVPETPTDVEDWRAWLTETWLPEIKSAIRHHRQITWLIDDAQMLNELDRDIFTYLNDLLANQPRLKLVLAIDIEYETALNHMNVLVKPTQVIRLMHLTYAETNSLLCEPVRDIYTLTDDALSEVYRLTGGQPQWVQRTGFHIFRQHHNTLITETDIKAIVPVVYSQSYAELEALWKKMAENERLVLSAVSNLLYADPLRSLDNTVIATWLVETDYPMDETAVNAAIRSLEYSELLSLTGRELSEIRVSAGLFERWLIENARTYITEQRRSGGKTPTVTAIGIPNRQMLIITVIIAVLLLAMAVLAASGSPPPVSSTPRPTVTLVNQP